MSYIKCLLSRLHGEYLKLDHAYPVDLETMHRVSSLPRSSEYPAEAISVCDIKADKFYHKYGTHKVFCGMMISTIQEPEVRFSTQVLAGKLIRKCQKGECLVGVLFSMERCTQGIEM